MLRRKSRFAPKAGNGETILTSERYGAEGSPEDGIESVKKKSALDGRYDREGSSRGRPVCDLEASNGQAIGASEVCSSESARDGGAASVRTNGPMTVRDERAPYGFRLPAAISPAPRTRSDDSSPSALPPFPSVQPMLFGRSFNASGNRSQGRGLAD